jgi:hypothetical protein
MEVAARTAERVCMAQTSRTSRTQPVPATRDRRVGPTSSDLERRLEAFLLIARRVGLS